MSVFIAKELSEVLNTRLTIGKINIGLLNRIIIDDVLLDDQSGKEMLKVTRLSAKFDILPFFKGKISISSVQLFGFTINLNKETPDSPPNFKFVLDAFASKDTVKKESSLDLRINSVLIRRGRMAYHVLSEEKTPGKFNAKHVQLQNIIANISLKAMNRDSLNLGIKRLSFDEKASGFSLKKMSLKLVANDKRTNIENFAIELPETSLKMDTIHLVYDSLKAFDQFSEKVHFSFRTLPSQITLKDISPFCSCIGAFQGTDNAGYAGKRNGRPAYLLSSGDYGRRPPVPAIGGCIASGTIESAGCVCVREAFRTFRQQSWCRFFGA